MESSTLEVEQKALTVPEKARSMEIKDNATFVLAGELLKGIKDIRKEIDETFDPIVSKAHAAHKEAVSQKKKAEAPLVEAEMILKPKIATYLTEQERIRVAEERRLQEEARRQEEAARLAEAVHLEQMGEPEEVVQSVLEEPIIAPPVIVPKSVPKVSGISMRENWRAEGVNLLDLCKAIAAGKAPVDSVQFNMPFLNMQARSLKKAFGIPGVRAVSDNNISASRG